MRRRDFIAGLGSAAVWPVVARAQQPAMPVIGFLTSNRSAAVPHYTAAFREGLAETGFVEGRNVKIEYRFAEQHLERIPALAVDLVRRGVAVIFSSGGDVPAMVAKGATSTIPIVFVSGYDPVKSGLVASLNRPGGNITGATVIAGELGPKRVELLRDLVPQARAAGLMINPNEPNAESDIASAQAAAQSIGLQIHILNADSEQDVEKIFTTLVDLWADGLLVYPSPLFQNLRQKIVAMVARARRLLFSRLPRRRRPHQLRGKPYGALPARGYIRRPRSQGREACRPACGAAHQIRAGDQSRDRQGARSDYTAGRARARR
jgi:putative tryptophan/tyrosine transport system substrate-binding protein